MVAAGLDVLVVGSANLDVVLDVEALPGPGSTVLAVGRRQGPGGKGANQAVAAARQGATTALLAALGDDTGRDLLVRELTSAGVLTDLLRTSSEATGTAFVLVDAHGENSIVVDPGANAALDDLTPGELEAVAGAAVVLCQLEVPLRTVTAAARAARGLVVLNAAPSQPLPAELTASVGVLVVNEHEIRELAGEADVQQAVAVVLELVPEVVVTLGAEGALVAGRDEPWVPVPGEPARQVVDTTGAGDTFCGAYAAARARGGDRVAAVTWAVRAAALSVERPGAAASAPTRAEVLRRWPGAGQASEDAS
jgi:ribokinase